VSFVATTNPRWDSVSFLQRDVVFGLISDMCIQVTSINMDFLLAG